MRAAAVLFLWVSVAAAAAGAARAAAGDRPDGSHGSPDARSAASDPQAATRAQLERLRESPALSNDPTAVDSLARSTEALPPSALRAESRMFVAQAWLDRLGRWRDAVTELRLVAMDPAADPLVARLAERQLVEALCEHGRTAEAKAETDRHAELLDEPFRRRVERLARRPWIQGAAVSVVAAFAALASRALLRARSRPDDLGRAAGAVRAIAPVALVFAAFVAGAGGALAAAYDAAHGRPFLLVGLAVLPLALLARAWSAVGSSRRRARLGRAALCATSVLAAAFLLLDAVNPQYLEGFGL